MGWIELGISFRSRGKDGEGGRKIPLSTKRERRDIFLRDIKEIEQKEEGAAAALACPKGKVGKEGKRKKKGALLSVSWSGLGKKREAVLPFKWKRGKKGTSWWVFPPFGVRWKGEKGKRSMTAMAGLQAEEDDGCSTND